MTPPTNGAESDAATITVREARRRIGDANIARSTLYDAIKRHQLPAVKIGKRVLILRHQFNELLEKGTL